LEKKWKSVEKGTLNLDRAGVIELAIECISTVCATDFKASEIEIGISSTAEDEKGLGGGRFRQMDEAERDEWITRVGEKD
jgi:20S proteasome subunit alpha 1